MAKKAVFNTERPTYQSIVDHHRWSKDALLLFFTEENVAFLGLSPDTLSELRERELEAQAQQDRLALLAFLEAEFRVDYISRARLRLKDRLSKALREVFREKKYKASLADDIVGAWRRAGAISNAQNEYIRESLQLRNWLAHGQYLVRPNLKVGDFYDLSTLVEGLINTKVFKVAP